MTYNPQNLVACNVFNKRSACNDEHKLQRKNGIIKGFEQTQSEYPDSLLEFSSEHNPHHPTQKPLALISYLTKTYSNKGELVLDFTMGSWTTARACKDLGRNFIGFELSEKYCKVGEERLRQENLF